MMAVSKKMLDQEPSEIEMLLPFHAAGTLNARDARRVDEALASDPELARQYAVIREEYAETIHPQREPGAPSARAMQKLFAAIDGEPVRKPSLSTNLSARVSGILRQAFAAHAGLVGEPRRRALLLQAGVIGAVLMKNQTASFQTASLSLNEPSRAHHPRSRRQRCAAARAGAVCAGSAHRRHHRAARQLSGLDRRWRQGRHVPAAVRQPRDEQGRSRKPDEQAAGREDRQPCGGDAVSRSSRARQAEVPWSIIA